MASEQTLQGWVPELGAELQLAKVIDLAFDYRGDVTVEYGDGDEVVGYVYNRNGSVDDPFIQMIEWSSGRQLTIPYSRIAMIRFTGRDTAVGKSYEAWKQRKEKQRSGRVSSEE